MRGFCVWLTGLSGSGKTTTANALVSALDERGLRATLLDGDEVRRSSPGLGFSKADREAHVLRVGQMALEIVSGGGVAICAMVSPFADTRHRCRVLVGPDRFVEIFVATPLDVCRERDPKGLYARAARGEVRDVTGLDAPYEHPETPEIRLDTVAASVGDNTGMIVRFLEARGLVPS